MSRDFSFYEKGFEYIKLLKEDPCLAASELLNVDLAVPQRIILRDMWEKPFSIVTAGRGTGKCVVGDTLIPTSSGLIPIEEMGNKLNPLSDVDFLVKGTSGLDKANKWYYDGVQETVKVETSFGYSLEGTPNHKILVLSKDGDFEWKTLRSLSVGDKVPINRASNLWPKEDKCSEEEATLLGLLVGDGCFRGNKYDLSFTNGDSEILDLYFSLFNLIFRFAPSRYNPSDRCSFIKSSRKSVWEHLERLGLQNDIKSKDKSIPSSVLCGSRSVASSFLRGLFEADGGVDRCRVTFCTKSDSLAHQVHKLLLNFGIISRCRRKSVNYKQSVRIYNVIEIGSDSVDVFEKEIGFLSSRKSSSLERICGVTRNPNVDLVYGIESLFSKVSENTKGVLDFQTRKSLKLKEYSDGMYNPSYKSLFKIIKAYPFNDGIKSRLRKIHDANFFYDSVVSVEDSFSPVYDLVVPETNSFTGNGFINHNTFLLSVFATLHGMLHPGEKIGLLSPSFRQSKMIFEEVQRRFAEAPLLREACVKKPIIGSDRCYLHFRTVGDNVMASVEAHPLGDGSRIRGLRFHVILVDEFAQVNEDIFNTVIRPMGATVSNPMENVRRIRKMKDQLSKGHITQDEYDTHMSDDSVNKIIGVSSAYFQFNHMYKKILAYQEEVDKGSKKYAVHFISYKDMPEGFLDKDNIDSSKKTMSTLEFAMEYEGEWKSDSDGIFKASLLEGAKSATAPVRLVGDTNKQYVMGVDPARSSDAFAIVLIEIGSPSFVAHAFQATGKKFPEMANIIYRFANDFNVIKMYMDAGSGGGGVAIKDILASTMFPNDKILDMEDPEYDNVSGRKILKMFDPKPKSIANANFSSLNLIEQKNLVFPLFPQYSDKDSTSVLESRERVYGEITTMLRQMMSIVVTETKSGLAHFDIPASGKSKSRKKDLYSAFILSALALHEETLDRVDNSHKLHDVGGLILPRERVQGLTPSVSKIYKAPPGFRGSR